MNGRRRIDVSKVNLTMAEGGKAFTLANFASASRLAGYNLHQCRGVASIREHVILCGWHSPSFAVHFLFIQGSCRLGISTLTVKQFSQTAHFATLLT